MEDAANIAASVVSHSGDTSSATMAGKNEGLTEKIEVMQNHIEDLLDRNTKAHQEIDTLTNTLKSRDQELGQCRLLQSEIEMRAGALSRQLERKEAENVTLSADKEALGQQLSEAIRAKLTAVMQLDDLASREEAFANRQKIFAQEAETLRSQKAHLEKQVARCETELTAALNETRISQLEEQLRALASQLQVSEESAAAVSDSLSREQAKVQQLTQQLASADTASQALQEAHKKEVEAQARMAQLYQEESREAQAAAQQYKEAVSQLQMALRETSDKLGQMDAGTQRVKEELQAQLELKEQEIKALKQQVQDNVSLLESSKEDSVESFVARLFPTAATVSKHLQPDLTLSKIYSRYADAVNELEAVKGERDKLTLRLQFLTSELEVHEGEVATTRAALSESQAEAQRLQAEKNRLESECEEVKNSAQEAQRSAGQHAKDKARLLGQVKDLSSQVVRMVKDIEAARNQHPPPPLPDEPSPGAPVTKRLVLFRDVEEMQHRNIELLALVRELQERAEKAEKLLSSAEDVRAVSARLEEAREQVQRMLKSSEGQEQMLQILIRQRDHFEALAKKPPTQDVAVSPIKLTAPPVFTQQAASQFSRVGPAPGLGGRPTGPGYPLRPGTVFGGRPTFGGQPGFPTRPTGPVVRQGSPSPSEAQLKLRKTEEALATVNKDLETYKQETRSQFNMVTEQLETMRLQLSESKQKQAVLHATSESEKARLITARGTIEALASQVHGLQKMRNDQEAIIIKHEKSLVSVHQDMVATYTKLSQVEMALNRSQAEVRRLKLIESSLRAECDIFKKSSATQQMVLQSAQELRACRLTAEAEQRLELTQRLEAAHREIKELQLKMEEDRSRLVEEVTQLQGSLAAERATVECAKTETAQAQGEAARATERLRQAERDVLALRINRNPVTETEAQTDLLARDEENAVERLGQLQQQVAQLEASLSAARQEASQSSEQAGEAKQALANLSQQASQDKAAASQSLDTARLEATGLQARMKSLEAELKVVRDQLGRAEQQLEECRVELTVAQQRTGEAVPSTVDQKALQALKSALATTKEQALRTSEQLARETEQHRLDVQALATFRKQALASDNKATQLREKLEEGTKALAAAEQRMAVLVQGMNEREQEVKELQGQNTALLDQVQLMGAELCALKQGAADTSTTLNSSLNLSSGSLTEEEASSQEQLLQVLRHVRREKEVAETLSLSLQARAEGLSVQLETAQRQLVEARENAAKLIKQEEKNNFVEMTQARYNELMLKLESVNALTDLTVEQREKHTKLTEKLTEEMKGREEKLQIELAAVRGEAARWRSRVNQLTERANRGVNPEELKRVQQERENLQKQLAAEREEVRKAKSALSEREAELARLRSELAQTQTQIQSLQAQAKKQSEDTAASLAEKEAQLTELKTKEFTIRKIAKKYKTQFEELTQKVEEVKQQQEAAGAAGAQEVAQQRQQLEARVVEVEARAVSAEARATEAATKLAETQAKLAELTQQVNTKSKDSGLWEERSERMKQVLNSARQKISQGNATNNRLQQELTAQTAKAAAEKQAREEKEAQLAAVRSQYEGRLSRMGQENTELKAALVEAQRQLQQPPRSSQQYQQPQQSPQQQQSSQQQQQQRQMQQRQLMRQTPQSIKVVTSSADKSSVEPPTANIRPMAGPSQAKPQQVQVQQSATVTPTSRAAPMGRVKPIPPTVFVLPSQQQQQQQQQAQVQAGAQTQQQQQQIEPSSASVVEPQPSTSRQLVSVPIQEESSSSQTTTEGADESVSLPAAAANVVLVRPQELTSSPVPTTSQGAPPSLKRVRETEQTSTPEQPRLKLIRTETTPSTSQQDTPQELMVDSDIEIEEMGGNRELQPEPTTQEEGVAVPTQQQTNIVVIDTDDTEAGPSSAVEGPPAVQSELVRAVEALLDTPPQPGPIPDQAAPSVPRPPTQRPSQAHLVLPPQQQGYEEVGDDGIVPSTPTLFVSRRREGFGEGVSSPQVPQAQGRLFTFTQDPSQAASLVSQGQAAGGSEGLQEARLEPTDESGTGRSVPTTPLLVSPQEPNAVTSAEVSNQEGGGEVTEAGDRMEEGDSSEPSSGVPLILVTPASEVPERSTPPLAQSTTSQEQNEATPPPQQQQPMSEQQDNVEQTEDTGGSQLAQDSQMQSPSRRGSSPRGGARMEQTQGRPIPSLMRSMQQQQQQQRSPIVWGEAERNHQQQLQQQAMIRGGMGNGMNTRRAMRRGAQGRSSPLRGSARGSPGRGTQGAVRRPGNTRPARRPY